MKYRFIKEQAGAHAVKLLCKVMRVSPQAYYRWGKRQPSRRQHNDEALIEQIRCVHQSSRRTYGSPRVHRELGAQGIVCSRKRVARLMRLHSIRARSVRRFRLTTDSSHGLPVAANVLDRQFGVPAPNRVWVTDITYVPTAEGWLYLCIFMDLFSRRVVGWAMSERMGSELVVSALSMAVGQRRPGAGLLVHSDRGSQYASDHFQSHLSRHGIVCSMSRRGNCWDNSVAESFMGTLKVELVHHAHYQTRAQARSEIFEYIEGFYNRIRRHSTLDYQTPLLFEQCYERSQLRSALLTLQGQEAYPSVNQSG